MAGSMFGKLIPLILLAVVLGGAAFVGYHIYQSVVQIRDSAEQRMAKRHNINFSKDGVRVGVKSIANESYVDKTQRWFVKAWELGNPAGEEGAGGAGGGAHGDEARKRSRKAE